MAYRPPHLRNRPPSSTSSSDLYAKDSGAGPGEPNRSASSDRRNAFGLHHPPGLVSDSNVELSESQPPSLSHLNHKEDVGSSAKTQGQLGPSTGTKGDRYQSNAHNLLTGNRDRFQNAPSQSHSLRPVPDLTDQTDIQLTEVTTRGRGTLSLPTRISSRPQRSRTPQQLGPAGSILDMRPPQKPHPPSRSTSFPMESPASDLKPTRRTFTPIPNEMELLASVSRSGGTEEGDALKNYDTQERLRGYIDEKIHRYHSDPEDSVDCLKSIVLLFRKLREGVLASGRLDEFTIELFEESIRYAILAHDEAQLLSALNNLVPNLYQAVDEKLKRRGDAPDRSVVRVVRHVRSLALNNENERGDNREFFSSLLLIYHLVHSSREVYQRTLEELTLPPIPLLPPRADPLHLSESTTNPSEQNNQPNGDSTAPASSHSSKRSDSPETSKPSEISPSSEPTDRPKPPQRPAFVTAKSQAYARAAADALACERLDPIAFHRLVSGEFRNGKQKAPEALERLLLSWAAPRVRELAVPLFKKSYMSASIEWASLILGLEKKGVEMWALANGFSIRDGILKLR